MLDHEAVPRAADRVALHGSYELARVLSLATQRASVEWTDAEHVAAIQAHVEITLEAMWRDRLQATADAAMPWRQHPRPSVSHAGPPATQATDSAAAAAEAAAAAAVQQQHASERTPRRMARAEAKAAREAARQALREENAALKEMNQSLCSKLEVSHFDRTPPQH